jgi:hypothetical protein
MTVAFTKAFEVWETEWRNNPEQFMSADEVAAAELLPLSEQCAVYFEAILNKLADGKPWNSIGVADSVEQAR